MLGAAGFVFTQLVPAVAMLREEHLEHPQLLISTPIVDFHLPVSASVTCLIAPQPVLKRARPTHFQWQVFAGPFWSAQTETGKTGIAELRAAAFRGFLRSRKWKGSLDLAKLQLKWGITAINLLKAGQQLQYNCSHRLFQQQLNEVCCTQLQIAALPH